MATQVSLLGANVDQIDAGTTTDGERSLFKLGTRCTGQDNTEYVYCQAGAALMAAATSPNAIAIDENYQAQLMTSTLALAGHELGFCPQQIIADNSFFWARVGGSNFNARVEASAAADTYLRTTATAGRLGTTSSGSAVVFTGVVLVTAASASTSANNTVREVLMTKGRAVRQGITLIS